MTQKQQAPSARFHSCFVLETPSSRPQLPASGFQLHASGRLAGCPSRNLPHGPAALLLTDSHPCAISCAQPDFRPAPRERSMFLLIIKRLLGWILGPLFALVIVLAVRFF